MQTVKVNGQVIPEEAIQFELERLVRFYTEHGMSQEQIRGQLPTLVQKAAEQAIGTKLMLDEAARLHLPVSDAEVNEQIEKIVLQVGGQEAFAAALKQQSSDEATFREQVRRGRRVDKLVEQAVAGVAEPSEAELQAHFEANKEEFKTAGRVLAQHILITPDGDTATSKAEAKAKIEAVRERVVGGKDFADEAAAHSMCPSGKEGGSLGWFARGMMVPEFDGAVFAMEDGQVSEIIETQFGYHIIYKTAHEEAGEADFGAAREQIRDLIRHSRRGEAMTAYVDGLKAKATVEYI